MVTPDPRRRAVWPWVLGTAVVVVGLVFGIQALVNGDGQIPTSTSAAATTVPGPATSVPPPASTAPSTSVTDTAAPSTVAATSTTVASTSTTTAIEASYPKRALAFVGPDVAWLDTTTGMTDVIHEYQFEARYPGRMSLSPDGSRAYFHLSWEDSWFSCESVSGYVTVMDVASGQEREIAKGLPALSPDGSRLAYLTSDECFPDPETAGFFVSVFTALVIADDDGKELARFGLEGQALSSPAMEMVNLVWEGNDTVLVLDGAGTTYAVPAEPGQSDPVIQDYPVRSIPPLILVAVKGGVGIGYPWDDTTGPGRMTAVDLSTGDAEPVPELPQGFAYPLAVSADGELAVAIENRLFVGLDPSTGQTLDMVDLSAPVQAIDW